MKIARAAWGAVGVMVLALLAACTDTPEHPPAPATASHAEADGLALTPPMGWYPWTTFGEEPQNERLIKEIVDALVASGMKDAGYAYVAPDEGICFSRGADGKLTTNLARYSSGFRGLGDYIHAKGLKYALYTDAGTKTCSEAMPGTKGYEYEDMKAFAEWRADYIKRLVQHRGPGHRPDLCGARQGPAGRRPPRRPQPLFVGRGISLEVGGRHRAHVADDDRHLRPGTGRLGQGGPDRLRDDQS